MIPTTDPLKEKIARWSLERVQFLLAHIESFVENDPHHELRERARNFVPQTGLEQVKSLVECDPRDPRLPAMVMERLTPFFETGLLLQRGLNAEEGNWWLTDLFSRGNTFHLDLKDQVMASALVPEISPLQVRRAPADKIFSLLNLEFLRPALDREAQGYLLRPSPSVGYVLFSHLAPPWALDHIDQAHRLVNKCFLY